MNLAEVCLRAVEFRASDDSGGDGRTLEGYAAVFDTPARIDSWEGSWDEAIERGAFRKTLRKRTPVMQFDHGRDARTGSVPIGKFEELTEDEHGLFVRGRLFDNTVVDPVRQAIEGGAIDGMSFRFQVAREEWYDAEGKKLKREQVFDLLWAGMEGIQRKILEIDPLYEAGPVVFPAYDATSVGVRSMLAQLGGDERKSLIRQLADELRPAVLAEIADNENFTGRPDARSTGGGDAGESGSNNGEPSDGGEPITSKKTLERHRVLRVKGIVT